MNMQALGGFCSRDWVQSSNQTFQSHLGLVELTGNSRTYFALGTELGRRGLSPSKKERKQLAEQDSCLWSLGLYEAERGGL